jgi:deoxyribose-phosphate aldolase
MSLIIKEIEYSVAGGANEIDILISRCHVLNGAWQAHYDEVRIFCEVCCEAYFKTILSTGELVTLSNVAKAPMMCMIAGSDFIKMSTGQELINAILLVSLVIVKMI